ncbi:MAG: TetR/AcrR family transcriptional regulator [Hyphomonadaceae bacterium]
MDEKTATRDRILQAASARIVHYGYGKTTMAEIAADCAMSPGNIYRFFEAKIDIAEAMARQHYAVKFEEVAALARRKDKPADWRLREIFLTRLRDNFAMVSANAKVLEVAEVLRRERPLFAAQNQAQERVWLAALIHEGVEAGLFQPCEAEFVAEMMQAATSKYTLSHVFANTPLAKLERELNGVLDLIFNGIYAR